MAGMGVDISFLGDKQLSRKLSRLDNKMQRSIVRKALRQAAAPVLGGAKALAPVLTGRMRDSLRIRASKGRRGTIGVVIETGKRDELGISKDDQYFYPTVIEYKYKSFMRASLDANQQAAFAIAKQFIKSQVESSV